MKNPMLVMCGEVTGRERDTCEASVSSRPILSRFSLSVAPD